MPALNRSISIPRPRLAELALLIAIGLPFLFAGLGFDFLDPGEGLYGTVPAEMVAGGDWVFPHFDGLPYLEKPPLYYWLAATAMAASPISAPRSPRHSHISLADRVIPAAS